LDSFDPTKPIKLIIHGFNDKATSEWVIDMATELLKSVCDASFLLSLRFENLLTAYIGGHECYRG
jgi:hypothetical protein